MRLSWLIPLALSACTPHQYHASDSQNCGTPDEYKPCVAIQKARAITWKPPPRVPVYAEQLNYIPGNIPLTDMPDTIAVTGRDDDTSIDDHPLHTDQ
jgi:hypothetical protein